MIFIETAAGQKFLILEPRNMKHLEAGGVVTIPDRSFGIMYTPDAVWLAQRMGEIAGAGVFNPEVLGMLHKESMDRPPYTPDESLQVDIPIVQDGRHV